MAARPVVPFARRLEDAQRLHARGDAASAAKAFAELDRERPDHPTVLHALGVALAQIGRLQEAEAHLTRAVQREPGVANIRFDLAALRDAQGRPDEAEGILRELVGRFPDHAAAWAGIGAYRMDANDPAGAARAFERAYRAAPDRLSHATQAAALLPPDEGAAILAELFERMPDRQELLLPLAELLMRADQIAEAEGVLNILKGLDPKSAVVRRHLGQVYARQSRLTLAASELYEAMLRDPDDAVTWTLISTVRERLGDSEGAVAALDRALAIVPDSVETITLRARIQHYAGLLDDAQGDLDALSASVREKAEVRMVRGMMMPPIPESNERIDALRARWMETMADVEARPTFVPEPWESVKITGYFLGYQGREDRLLMEALARATLAVSPHLEHVANDLGGSGETKLRVGFLSASMRLHSVGRVLIKLMGALDRERFDVVLLQLPDKADGGQEWGERNADRTVKLPLDLDEARRIVEAQRLDVLIFTDLHLTPFQDALTYSRLAPVQATTWGHPGTGGRTTLDYWISCEDWELPGNDRLYTERLVRLPHPPFVYATPTQPDALRTRASFGLRDDARLYGSLQSLFKFHPDMDALFASILERDPKGRVVLIGSTHHTWKRQIKARFAKSFDPARVDFLPTVPNKEYMSAVAACDVMLDPIHFAGANTSLEAFAVGKPVVTLRGDQMRNRATGGFYRQMGYERLVADDHAAYVDLALRLAQDRRFYREAKETILANNHVLYENLEPVPAFEEWLLSVRK